MEAVKDILRDYDLRTTTTRSDILKIFLDNEFALAHGDIESRMEDGFDRVTVYRTLKTFLDKGILHKVLDDEGTTKYALCKEACSSHNHDHEHVHFKCTTCNNTTCLDEVHVPKIQLPSGYKFYEANLLVQGICKDCSK